MKIMKKFFAVITIVALVLSLSSCLAIDDLREHQMFYRDSSHKEIEFKDKIYKIVSYSYLTTKNLTVMPYERYNVTEKNVPVLLSAGEGTVAEFDKELDIIIVNENIIYCSEDNFEKYDKLLNPPDYTNLVYIYTPINWYPGDSQSPEYEIKNLDSDSAAKILDILKKGKAENMPAGSDFYDNRITSVYRTTDDGQIIDRYNEITIFEYKAEFYADDNSGKVFKLPKEIGEKIAADNPEGYDYYSQYSYYPNEENAVYYD